MESTAQSYKFVSRVLEYEAVLTSGSPTALLLGMVFAHGATEPKRGQEFRDHVRCQALRNQGFRVFTLDDKHEDCHIPEHCRANFADTRRMITAMRGKWDDAQVKFNHVILDYFFSPVGWARERWNEKFFYSTLPTLAKEGLLAEGGTIWLPHLDVISELLERHNPMLEPFFDIFLVENPDKNPLYKATNLVERDLLKCPDALTNETQMRPLWDNSDHPFIALVLKRDWHAAVTVTPPPTPKKSKRRLEIEMGLRRSPRKLKHKSVLSL